MRFGFLLRWSVRELRRRWIQVTAIALVIGIGTGVYSALGSTAAWRRRSNDASFEKLHMFHLRVKTADGVDAAQGAMLRVLDGINHRHDVVDAEERLIAPTQVDASTRGATILVPGRLIGVDVTAGGPSINGISVAPGDGRELQEADAGSGAVILERNFARFYDLPSTGALRLTGGTQIEYVGVGMSPEYFLVVTEGGEFLAQANFAAVFAPLATAQRLSGHPGRVNDLVLRLRAPAAASAVASELRSAFRAAGLAVSVLETRDDGSYRLLYDDIEGDRTFWNVFAGLILAGAAFGAFNLVSRMVEAQRREIGIGMAMGASPAELGIRHGLIGIEIAVAGAALGILCGLVVAAAFRPVFTSMLPLPVWRTDIQPATFLRGAAIGFALPTLATIWPVWRAVRVMPVDAIASMHRTSRGGLSSVLRRLPWPRRALSRMPIGNVLRTPRRTLLTALGIGAAVVALVSTFGMIDSFLTTLDRNDAETLQDHPDRLTVSLQGMFAIDAPELRAIAAQPDVGTTQPVLRVGGRLVVEGRDRVDVVVEALDLDGDVWSPTLVSHAPALSDHTPGILVSAEAAKDLGIEVGDRVALEHPAITPNGSSMALTPVTVVGVHPSPFRFGVFLDRSQLAMLQLPDVANELYVLPSPGRNPAHVQRALFGQAAVASAQPVSAAGKVVRDTLDQFIGIFRVLEVFMLGLALLIAYNATSINAEERRREHATVFAFGLPVHRVVQIDVVEGLLVGLLGTGLGIAGGLVTLQWMTQNLVGRTMPELGLDVSLSPITMLTAVALGVVAVAAAPVFTVRRMRRMDIPGTLRVVE